MHLRIKQGTQQMSFVRLDPRHRSFVIPEHRHGLALHHGLRGQQDLLSGGRRRRRRLLFGLWDLSGLRGDLRFDGDDLERGPLGRFALLGSLGLRDHERDEVLSLVAGGGSHELDPAMTNDVQIHGTILNLLGNFGVLL